MNIPPIGDVEPHADVSEWLISSPHTIKCLLGHVVQFVFEGYLDDPHKNDYHRAIQNLLELDSSALTAVAPYVLSIAMRPRTFSVMRSYHKSALNNPLMSGTTFNLAQSYRSRAERKVMTRMEYIFRLNATVTGSLNTVLF
jgi:hypothetical protein